MSVLPNYGFFKQDLDKLLECLGIPEKIVNKEQFAVVWMEFR